MLYAQLRILFFALLVLFFPAVNASAQTFITGNGQVKFSSSAPQEIISATSSQLTGAIKADKKTFIFLIDIQSFLGFNSPLQKEHFHENYMETRKHPTASFTGKIIEDIDLTKEGTYTVRTKGKLLIHGVSQEKIIRATVKSRGGQLTVTSDFSVLLSDFLINIPRLVAEKLSPEIQVSVHAVFKQK